MRIASKMGASGSTYAAGTDEPDLYFYHTDHLGSTTYITDRKEVAQYVAYTPYGETFKEYKNVTPYRFNGKELDQETGYYYYGARYYDPSTALWFGTDPLQHKYPMNSPYVYCNGNPVKYVDPDGRDWYQSDETGYYTWFEGSVSHNGYSYIGGKGSVLGEFEGIIDNIMSGKEDGLGLESMYSNGFTFDISSRDKGCLIGSNERDWDFFSEFIFGTGPEFSVILPSHPYVETLRQEKTVIDNQLMIKDLGEQGKRTAVRRNTFYPWQASLSSPMQFIGTYRYDGYSSADGMLINNVVTDSKSCTSLFYHLPGVSNHRRVENKEFGNTYQFYIWQSRK